MSGEQFRAAYPTLSTVTALAHVFSTIRDNYSPPHIIMEQKAKYPTGIAPKRLFLEPFPIYTQNTGLSRLKSTNACHGSLCPN